ncbi:MAG: tetratricopeptide repeat protein [Bacteroidetes bacterium]|nr:tetratricopeptide repeat protein [Bacteroidota bacterium]
MNENESKIPSGNVTFLFTDIEGSTKLSQDFPELLPAALERHNTILRDAVESNNGHIFKIAGDAYCCAFQNADDAVKAAVDAQLKLSGEKWNGAVIKVRMGIHSGKAEWNGKDYMGYITLARASRVMSAAYGEQILISNDAHILCLDGSESPGENKSEINTYSLRVFETNEISFRDLGERRLKDVIQPIRLYQITGPGLRADFPPLKTLDARPNNLPVQLTNFIGREEEIKHAKELLSNNRLLTLTGAGGAGKTRFALQTGADLIDDFLNGVWLVELAAISDTESLPEALINIFGLKEEPNKTPEETLTGYLKDKEILVILDNCEHLVTACAELAERLLISCPELKIIATSREALNCAGEQIYKIPPLTQPDPSDRESSEQLSKYESVRLFIERALAVNPDFQADKKNSASLAEICSSLDGIPLAIELAAARTKVLTVEQIRDRLDDRFNLLSDGKRTSLPRQQTLKALIDWSYDLLTEKEKLLWKRLSVFKGGWTIESAEGICSDNFISKKEIIDLLGLLAEKSIISFDYKKERYSILETMKQYGADLLKTEKGTEKLFGRYLNYFMEFSENAEPRLSGEGIINWLEKLETDHLNLQSAIEWSVISGEREKGARLAGSLWRFWDIRGHISAGRKLTMGILNNPEGISKPALAKLILRAAQITRFQGDYKQAEKYYNDCLILSRELGDIPITAASLNGLGNVALDLKNYKLAKQYYLESLDLRRQTGDKDIIANSFNNLGNVAFILENYDECLKFYEESLKLKREIGDKRGIANSLHNLSNLAFDRNKFDLGRKYSEESLEIRKELGDKNGIAESLFNLGNVSMNSREFEKAQKFFEESLEIYRELEDKSDIEKALSSIGYLKFQMGKFNEAGKYFKDCMNLSFETDNKKNTALNFITMAEVLSVNGEFSKAAILIGSAQKIIKTSEGRLNMNKQNQLNIINTILNKELGKDNLSRLLKEGAGMSLRSVSESALSAWKN